MAFYHPLRWYNFKRLNNRTHRDLVIVDGKVGFLGGAGVSDRLAAGPARRALVGATPWCGWTATPCPACRRRSPRTGWRPTDEILTGDRYFPFPRPAMESTGPRGDRPGGQQLAVGRPGHPGPHPVPGPAGLGPAAASTSPPRTSCPTAASARSWSKAVRERGVSVKVVTAGEHVRPTR